MQVRWLVLLLMSACPGVMRAQSTPPWGFAPDSTQAYQFNGAPVARSAIAQGYQFEMVYDSICHVSYLATEFRRNGQLLQLAHWKDGRLAHAHAEYLTYNSRTHVFPITAGDTVSFYRELRWYHPLTKWQDTNTYYALDTLEYIVHLVRASDGAPIGIIDSTGILARTTIGVPRIYGPLPIMAIARYIVPSAAGDSAFIGVTVRPKGSGAYHFTRFDTYTVGVSNRLTQGEYITYLAHFSSVYGRRNVNDFAGAAEEGFRFDVDLALSSREVHMAFAIEGDAGREPAGRVLAGRVSIEIYDVTGRLLGVPYNAAGSATGDVRYRLPQSGIYFVALLHDDRIVRAHTITVN